MHLEEFHEPPPNFAILSHVWGPKETSFQEIRAGLAVSSKVAAACAYARADGFLWLWADMCCIDKTNSAELSEAINSMFKWYSAASVCYAYLHDVPAAEDPSSPDSSFRRSTWHTRGWTLQELLAPRDVLFLSREWLPMGNKELFAPLLETITGIDVDILTFRTPLSAVPINRRMSWASMRRTTRIEDEAYCLMGIFDINMPTIYGEGRRAFRRLQDEIVRHTIDHTIFTWGPSLSMPSWLLGRDVGLCKASDAIVNREMPASMETNLLAQSPQEFSASTSNSLSHICAIHDFQTFKYRLRTLATLKLIVEHHPSMKMPKASYSSLARITTITHRRITETPHITQEQDGVPEIAGGHAAGIRVCLPILNLGYKSTTEYCLAILPCWTSQSASHFVCLILRRSPYSYPVYGVGATFADGFFARYLFIDPSHPQCRGFLSFSGNSPAYEWRDVYISQRNPVAERAHRQGVPLPIELMGNPSVNYRVFIPAWLSTAPLKGFTMCSAEAEDEYHTPRTVAPAESVTYVFQHRDRMERFTVHVRTCGPSLALDVQFVDPQSAPEGDRDGTEQPQQSDRTAVDSARCHTCLGVHLGDWLGSRSHSGYSAKETVDSRGFRWHRAHVFSAQHRSVVVRARHMGARRGDVQGGRELWAIGVEVLEGMARRPAPGWGTEADGAQGAIARRVRGKYRAGMRPRSFRDHQSVDLRGLIEQGTIYVGP